MSNATRFPLSWPAGIARTLPHRRRRPKFKTASFAQVRDGLFAELKRAGATGVVLSTNVELRQDGIPYSGRRNPDDPGVAVYFARKGRQLSVQCDQWVSVEANLRAIADVIEAIRLIERRGTQEMVDAAYTGFAQLAPPKDVKHWSVVLRLSAHASADTVHEQYRLLAKMYHPDRNPGDDEAAKRFAEVSDAYEQFKRERGL